MPIVCVLPICILNPGGLQHCRLWPRSLIFLGLPWPRSRHNRGARSHLACSCSWGGHRVQPPPPSPSFLLRTCPVFFSLPIYSKFSKFQVVFFFLSSISYLCKLSR